MGDELWQWDGTALADAIAKQEVSSRQAVTACFERLDRINPRINAVVETRRAEALAEADLADAAVMRGEPLGLLHGVPVTTKINVDQAGSATTSGVVAYKDRMAIADSPPVANWRKAGAIIIGRTNAPCYSHRWFTDNGLYGSTLNPWNPTLTTGGSSGGAAAAVATGLGPLAHGTDLAGSVRWPASACGVYGLRPSFGRVPAYNDSAEVERSICLQLGSTQGVIARSIRDLRSGLAAMAARDDRDPWWTPVPADYEDRRGSRRVALLTGLPGIAADPEITETLQLTARWLEEAGYAVEEATPPRLEEAANLWLNMLFSDSKGEVAETMLRHGDERFRRAYLDTARIADNLTPHALLAGLATRTTILRAWMAFFQRFAVLVLPTSWRLTFPADYDQRGPNAIREVASALTPLTATALLGLPALSVPVATVAGTPVGIQIVGGRFQEAACLAAAEALEARIGRLLPIDPRPL